MPHVSSAPAPDRAATLRAEGLTKTFGAREALRDVTFDVAAGERVALIGPNGAGKTTLLSLLAGLQRPTSGTVSLPPREIGWVPQQVAVYRRLSVRENLRLFARLEKVDDIDGAVDRALALTDLADRERDELGTLSGGNQQRVNIAIGLLADPPVLLLDEPSSSLDPRQRAVLWQFIEGLAKSGTAVVFATHEIAEAQRHAERILVLADGQLIFVGTGDELRAAGGTDDLEAAFVALLEAKGH
ncbi:MAG: ABC transporter ATP-binding protein [Solirubrobacteraceae bacterium]|nr:ABC transporter ATP-binding protein [Solirubrobacteraceae bacterium]